MTKTKTQSVKWYVFRFMIVAAIFVFLYRTGQLGLSNLREVFVRPEMFGAAAICIFIHYLLTVQRWRILLTSQDMSLGFWMAMKLTFIGYFFSTALPGAVSGDIVKAYYVSKGKEQKAVLVTTVVFDRLLGMYTMVFVPAIAILVTMVQTKLLGQQTVWSQPSVKALGLFVFTFFLFLTLIGILFMSKRLRRSQCMNYILKKIPFHKTVITIYDAVHHYGQNLKLTLNAFLISLLSQMFLYTGIYFLCILLTIQALTTVNYLFALPVSLFINAIPLAPGGLGVGEAGFQGIFLLFGSHQGAEAAILFHAIFFILAIGVGGLIYLVSDLSYSQ